MERVAEKQNILIQVVVWWILETPKKIISAWKNFLRFNLNYFSVSLLLRTLFSPWRKYEVYRGRGFNIGKYIETFFSNLIFRLIGALLRSALIAAGLIAEALILLAGVFVFSAWIASPLIIAGAFAYGLKLLI
jgi:hypothetical protein